MKKFKTYLREFILSDKPKGPGGDEIYKRIRAFMQKTPFTHVMMNGDELHFIDSLDAANNTADTLANHEHGMRYANEKRNRMMQEYFGMSTGTHDDVLRGIQEHIENHPDLPIELAPHIEGFMNDLTNISRQRSNSANLLGAISAPSGHQVHPTNSIGVSTYEKHLPKVPTEGRHPHFANDTKHLKDLIQRVQDDPSRGYFLRKEEM